MSDVKKLYNALLSHGYTSEDLGDENTFTTAMSDAANRKELYDGASANGLDLGDYDEYEKRLTQTSNNTIQATTPEPPKAEEVKPQSRVKMTFTTPNYNAYSFTSTTSKKQDVATPMMSEEISTADKEELTTFGEGVKQGVEGLEAGVQYAAGEAIAPILGTSLDDKAALEEIERLQAEGKDVAKETKNTTTLAQMSPTLDKALKIFGGSKMRNALGGMEKDVERNITIQKALKKTGGDVEQAKKIITEQADKEYKADQWRAEAEAKMAQAKPTKGWAWVGSMIPQMTGQVVGLGLSAVTKSPIFAQALGMANMGVLTASTAGQAMAEARQAGASNSQVWASGIANGAVELLTEKIPYNRYVGRISKATKDSVSQTLGKAVSEVGSPANKELKDLLSKANKQLGGKLFSGKNVEDFMGDLVSEGLSEATAEGLQTILPIIYENPENYPTFSEIIGNALEGAKGGIFMGAFLGGASKAAEHRMNRARRKAQGYVDVAEVTTPDGKDEIVEVVRNEQDQPVFYWNGEQIPISKDNVKQRQQFNFDDFERGQFQLEEDEAYENGKTLETPAEMTDANNMYEIAAIELAKRSFGLQDQEIDSKSKEDVEGIVNQIELMYGGNPLQKAHDIRDTDSETSDLILNYAYAKATRDGVIDAARDRISEESAQAEAIIDYRKNKNDGMIHPATLKTKDANGNDRQVYIVSGNIVTFEDGTINTQESDNDVIIQDAVTGKPEFATAKDLLRAEQAIDPEVEKQNVRNTIADTIATEVENKMNNVLPFNVGDAYNVIGADGAEHSVQIIADNGDGSVMASIDNAEAVAMPKSEIRQLSNNYNMNRAKLANEAQKEAKQSEEMMQEAQNVEPTQEEVAEVAPVERVVPTTKDGNPDFNAMDAEMFVDEYVSRYGEDSAVKIARKNISNARENIAKIDKKIDDITDPNQMEGLYVQRKNAEAQIARYSDILDRLGASEDANETEADQRNRLRNDAGNRIATLFPDGMPNVESVILADIATGNRIRWSDKTTNGAVTSRGLGAELGYTEAERRKRLPLIGKDAMTPEEYAESLRERLDALGVRYDESSLRDAVLSVYQSVDSRKGAWDALENIAKRGAEQEVDTDWESMQQERVYNKAQEVAENTPESPSLETIEEETPITEGEYAEMGAEKQAEEQKDYDAMIAENPPVIEESAEDNEEVALTTEKRELQNKIQDWLTPENVSWAEGRELNESIEKFGNTLEPIAILPKILNKYFPNVPLYLYSGKGYLIDHAANHHPELSADEYNKIQEVLDSYDDIKDVSTPKTKKIAFVKMLDKGFAVVAELAEKDGKIMLHKTFFYKDAQGKRVPYKNKPSLLKESSVDGSTTISPAESAAGRHRNISALDVSSESKDTTSEPKSQEVDEKILQEEQKVNVNPTDGQKEAGNYKKGHVVVDGFNITIEQPKGSVRSGVDADGKEWSITMNNTYGYIRGTEGVDGDHIDVFLSDNLDNWGGEVFVVDQINTDGSFDEHKVMYGFNSIEEAQQAYLSNYSEGWQGLGAITGISKDEFKKWIASSHRKTKPFAEYKSVKTTEGQAVNTTDSARLAEDVTAIESNVDEKPVNKPKSDKNIEDFGEKIGGARKDVARARLLDTVKLSAKDLESLKDPDKILSRKAIIKYMEEGQMTENDGISLLALNMATRGKYRKALTMEKYREVALQWERGEDIDVGITEQDIDKYMANMPEAARVKPNARERAISDLERIILTPYNDYRDTYIALNYPAEYRNLRGTYIYKTAWNDKVVVVSGIDSRRGFVFNTYEQAVAKIKRDFPIVEFEKSKEKSTAKDNKDSEGHLNITKDDMGWYRIKSRSIPGNIYLSGRFRTKKDAEAYLEQNKEVLLEREQKMTESLMGSNIGMVEREGVDYRNGQDVTPEDFLNTFGFRGVEFGNWVPQAERQLYLNKTYDAIMDFCNIIGISPKAFSLGGELALAFGARGKSRALAHYEPLKMVINLTRMKGAGSLAHEWFHAFDNYISKRKTGNISDMATARFAAERDEVSRAFYDLVSKMNSMDYTKRSKRAGEYWGEVEECAARLLENYIYNELERKSQVSPLLVRKDTLFNEEEIPEEDYVKSAWPYPSARENKEIKPYFDHLFSTLEEKVDEQGNVILFRSSAPTYDDLKIRFAELQSEYDALDKDDEQALNAWRDKKAEVVRSFMEGKTEELNLPTKNFRIVKNEEELRSLYNDYSSAMNKWMQETNKDFVSIDSFNKFKERLSKAQALYSPVMDVIACDINSFPNDEAMAFTVLFHEQTHSVIDKVFKQKQLKDIWDEALVNDAKNANDISATYGDDVYENGNEYLAFILERFTFANYRNRLESFIKGDEAVLVDDLMKNAKETLPLRNEAIKKILKFYNDEYRKERGFRTETWNDGLGRGYAEGSREATTESSRGGSQSSRERRRSEVVEAATDLASSLGVKLNVIEDVNEITDSNIYNQRRKRDSKAWYSVTTGKVYFVLPNAESVADAQQSVLHEVVAHKGLRALFGKEFGEFINKVYQNADESIRTKIVELSKNKGWKIDVATEEYLASLAENTNFEDTNPSWWAKIKELFLEMFDKIGIKVFDKVTLTDNELRYILWRSYQMQKSQGAMAVAEDVLMQQKLGVGNFRTRPAGTRQMTEEEQIIAEAKANGTYLKAPNGKKSNLTPKQWVQVRTKAFKEWFGDWEYSPENASKVVDANGEPMVVYHYSDIPNITIFNPFRHKENISDAENIKLKAIRDAYKDNGRSLTRPFMGIWATPIRGEYAEYGQYEYELFANIRKPKITNRVSPSLTGTKGADGVFSYSNDVLMEVSTTLPERFKSATDNVGTFDANNDDIRFRTTPKSADIEDGEVKGESKEISKEDKMQNAIRELRKIVKSTKAFRKSLAAIIASNLKEIVTDDVINVMGKSEFNALVKQVQEANIQQDAVKPLERIEEIISDLRIKDKEQRINKLLSMKVQGETKSGVSVAQSVDDATRELFTYLKDNINRPIDEIRRSLEGQENHILANLVADIASPYQEATALKRDVLDINEEIKALKDVNTNLRGLLKDADDQKAKQLKQTIKNNKEKVSALETERLHIKAQIEQQLDFVYNTLFDAMQEGRGLYKTFVYENMLRKSEMVDMAIKDIDTGETLSVLLNPPTRWEAAKDKVADLLLSPANSLNHLLKKITINAPNGEGDMYDYFIRGKNGYVAASEKFYNGYNEFKEELNKKAKSVFGKPYIKVLADSNNLSNVTITVTTNDRKQDVPLTLGQAMYVYMVNKMPDGKVKLTNMGIFDEDVEKLRNSLPAEYIVFADWLQNKFLPKRRKEYNETHLEIFGTQMASIENYVPLRNKKDEIYKEVDGTQQEDFALPTTITGSIINRRRNNVILDLTTNALDLMLSHGQEMEHWNAYTPVVKDMNALLSSTKFRLMLENRRRGWWDDMDNAAKIAAGQYNPKTDKLNEAWAVMSKGAIASKISFRIWTAMKQVLSFPAFMAYSTSARFYGALAKNIATPYNAWVWGMQNLPILNKRWSERSLGNEKLSQVTRGVFGKILDESAKKGMMPNAFVDALTCAIGAKAVYDYKVKEYEAQMYNKDEAEYRAKIDATLAFNESQQSAEGLFLSQLQSNRDGLSTAFATFNNQNYGYLRKTIEAFLELRRKRDKEVAYLQDRYIQQGITPDDAERLARSKVKEIKKTAVLSAAMYGFILNLIWDLGSNVFKYAFSDDEDEVKKDILKSLLVAPIRNTTIGSMVQSVVQGYNVNLSVLISDINAIIDRSSTANVTRWDRTAAYLTLKLVASMAVGVDMDTLVRLYEGIEGMINDGVDVEDIMAIINAPRSQALMAARPPKEDESVKEYIERMDKIDRKIDSRISDSMRKTWINNYYMYQLANKNELNVSRDDFGKVSIIEYKQLIDEMKKTKEREKEYEEKGIPQSDLDAFAQQPEYKRMEIVDEHQKEINKSLKKLKTELSDSDRAKEEQNLYNEMRSLLKKVKPLGLSNK